MKIHKNLKWNTIISRINKIKNCEQFRIENDCIYELDIDEHGRKQYIFYCNKICDKHDFIEENNFPEAKKVYKNLTAEESTELLDKKMHNDFMYKFGEAAFGEDFKDYLR